MRIVITGHTKGLGKALYEYFSPNHSVTGYSRSNRYDLNRFSDTVVEKSLDSDIFINNACRVLSKLHF